MSLLDVASHSISKYYLYLTVRDIFIKIWMWNIDKVHKTLGPGNIILAQVDDIYWFTFGIFCKILNCSAALIDLIPLHLQANLLFWKTTDPLAGLPGENKEKYKLKKTNVATTPKNF